LLIPPLVEPVELVVVLEVAVPWAPLPLACCALPPLPPVVAAAPPFPLFAELTVDPQASALQMPVAIASVLNAFILCDFLLL
jgi:hypothetical protein